MREAIAFDTTPTTADKEGNNTTTTTAVVVVNVISFNLLFLMQTPEFF